MSHSKRNTSRSIFTSHERALAQSAWGRSSARLTHESFLPFAACSLCLEPAVDPVACPHGDVFCRECALSNILAQKKEIRRLQKAREQEDRDAAEQKARQDAEAKQRAVREFELTQAGFDVKTSHAGDAKAQSAPGAQDGAVKSEVVNGEKRGEKRKFSLDEEEVARIAAEERAKARKAIDAEKAGKPTLPSFWTPSITPTSNTKDVLHEVKKKTKSQPICPSSPEDKPHPYSLHTLITVNFSEEPDSQRKTPQRVCPACKKILSNASKAHMAKPCGHVLCKGCVGKFMQPNGAHDSHHPEEDPNAVRCFVCDADLTGKPGKEEKEKRGKEKDKIKPGLVQLRSEGTGFSAGGVNEVKKAGVAFQC